MNDSYIDEFRKGKEITKRLRRRWDGLSIEKGREDFPVELQEKIEAFKGFLQEYNKALTDLIASCDQGDVQRQKRIIREQRDYNIKYAMRIEELELMVAQIEKREQGGKNE